MIDGVKRFASFLFFSPVSHSTPICGSEGRRGSEASPRSQTTKTHGWSNKMNLESSAEFRQTCAENVWRHRQWLMASNSITSCAANFYGCVCGKT